MLEELSIIEEMLISEIFVKKNIYYSFKTFATISTIV